MDQEYVTLSAGNRMPMFGLGTWGGQRQIPDPDEVKKAIGAALDGGYRLIDTAYYYHNQKAIGEVVRERIAKGEMKREDIFITTKLGLIFFGSRDRVQFCIDSCLKDLGLDYVDLFLIHSPVGLKYHSPENLWPIDAKGEIEADFDVDLVKLWKYMEELVDQGKVKAIGVSNFSKEQIERLSKNARHPISNQQVELNAYFQREDMVKFCKSKNISVTAYAPMGSPGSYFHASGEKKAMPMEDPLIVSLAKKYNKTPAQILFRNLIQRGIAVVPKSVTPSRIQQNIQVYDFTLTKEEMDAIAKIDKNQRLFRMDALKKHPEYPYED